jgi:azurin
MKKITFSVLTLIALIGAGCGQSSQPTTTAAAATPAPSGPREIDISANDTMKYDITAISASPGESLKVVFTNAGTIPKEVMGHNWVLLNSNVDVTSFDTAASAAKETNYIPADRAADIIAKVDILGPRKSGEVEFKAPTTPGQYTFICTFPAHFQAGMHGILTVK